MRWLAWTLLILGLAIGVSLIAAQNTGYVLIKTSSYRVETSLNFLILIISLSFILLHLALRLIQYTRRLPATVQAYKNTLRQKKGRLALTQSLHALLEGQYLDAEKSAAKALASGEDAGISALIAARAAHKRKDKIKRDYFLSEAERLSPNNLLGCLLMHAEMLLDDQQYHQALTMLQRLDKIQTNYQPALAIELKVQTRLKNWERVLNILKLLENSDAIELIRLKEIKLQAQQALIKRYTNDIKTLTSYWKKLSEEDRFNERLVMSAVPLFIQQRAYDVAAEILEMNLTKAWSTPLVRLLGDCVTSTPSKQLQQAEFWLMNHHEDADLLEALGKICVRLKLWGKATNYYEASLSLAPTAARHVALAKLLEDKGQITLANQHYRESTNFIADLH